MFNKRGWSVADGDMFGLQFGLQFDLQFEFNWDSQSASQISIVSSRYKPKKTLPKPFYEPVSLWSRPNKTTKTNLWIENTNMISN